MRFYNSICPSENIVWLKNMQKQGRGSEKNDLWGGAVVIIWSRIERDG